MAKTVYCLAGLPRSGNTLLATILNQNPSVYCSPLSPLNELLNGINLELNGQHTARNKDIQFRVENTLNNFTELFYSDVNFPIVIDREKNWGTPDNLNLLKKYVNAKPKIIFTVRDILEILASYIAIDNGYFESKMYQSGLFGSLYRDKNDMICEYLMLPNNEIDRALLSLSTAFLEENKSIFHIVEYNDLVNYPEKTIENIYAFLGLEAHTHDFDQIIKMQYDNDTALGLPSNMHEVHNTITRSKTTIDILSEHIKNKYSGMEFWKNGSTLKITNI
jgi:sulfotransferase